MGSVGVIIYVAAWAVIPRESRDSYTERKEEVTEANNTYNNVKEYYYQGKDYWLNGKFEKAYEQFKLGAGITKKDNTKKGKKNKSFYYACLAMYYYEKAPVGSEKDSPEDYYKVLYYARKYIEKALDENEEVDLLVLYYVGDTAAKVGMLEEGISSYDPLYGYVLRISAMYIYNLFEDIYTEIEEKIDQYQPITTIERINGMANLDKIRFQNCLEGDEREKEYNLLMLDNIIKTKGFIQNLIVNKNGYSIDKLHYLANLSEKIKKEYGTNRDKENVDYMVENKIDCRKMAFPSIFVCSYICEEQLRKTNSI